MAQLFSRVLSDNRASLARLSEFDAKTDLSRCFTFSLGNEADYVILSSVRTRSAGFLKSQPRMNVGLTRCKKGMVVVTSKCFLRGAGRSTLLGKLEQAWTTQPPPRNAWIDWKAMLSKSVELPGLTQLSQHAQRLLLLLPPSTSAVPIPASTSRYNRPPPALSAAVTAAAAASINNNEHERARRFVVASTMFGAAASSSSSSSSSSPPTRGSSIRSLQAATTARRLEAGEDADDLLNERFPSLLPLTVALDQSLAAGSGRPASAVKVCVGRQCQSGVPFCRLLLDLSLSL